MMALVGADHIVEVRPRAVRATLVNRVTGGALALEGAFAAGNVRAGQQEAEVKDFFLFSAGAACIGNFDTVGEFLAHLLRHGGRFSVLVAVMGALASMAEHDARKCLQGKYPEGRCEQRTENLVETEFSHGGIPSNLSGHTSWRAPFGTLTECRQYKGCAL